MYALKEKNAVRRSATRESVAWPVRWVISPRHDWNEGTLRDVSRFGAHLTYRNPTRVPTWGDCIAIHTVIGSESLLVEGRVRWIRSDDGVGIAFLPEDGELAEALVWDLIEAEKVEPNVSGVFRRPF